MSGGARDPSMRLGCAHAKQVSIAGVTHSCPVCTSAGSGIPTVRLGARPTFASSRTLSTVRCWPCGVTTPEPDVFHSLLPYTVGSHMSVAVLRSGRGVRVLCALPHSMFLPVTSFPSVTRRHALGTESVLPCITRNFGVRAASFRAAFTARLLLFGSQAISTNTSTRHGENKLKGERKRPHHPYVRNKRTRSLHGRYVQNDLVISVVVLESSCEAIHHNDVGLLVLDTGGVERRAGAGTEAECSCVVGTLNEDFHIQRHQSGSNV